MVVWGGLTNSCGKKRNEKQRRKGKKTDRQLYMVHTDIVYMRISFMVRTFTIKLNMLMGYLNKLWHL